MISWLLKKIQKLHWFNNLQNKEKLGILLIMVVDPQSKRIQRKLQKQSNLSNSLKLKQKWLKCKNKYLKKLYPKRKKNIVLFLKSKLPLEMTQALMKRKRLLTLNLQMEIPSFKLKQLMSQIQWMMMTTKGSTWITTKIRLVIQVCKQLMNLVKVKGLTKVIKKNSKDISLSRIHLILWTTIKRNDN